MSISTSTSGTLTDVAACAGVSKMTASRVLNHTGPASESMRERILKAAREVDYVADAHFSRLSRNRGRCTTGNLGLLLTTAIGNEKTGTLDSYERRMFSGVEQEAYNRRYHLVVSTTTAEPSMLLPRVVMDRHVDGLLVHGGLDPEMLVRINDVLPVVLVNDRLDGHGISSVAPDEASGIRKALDHLRALAHERVTFFYIADSRWRHVHPHMLRAEAFRQLTMDGVRKMPEARVVALPGRDKPLEDALCDQLLEWQRDGRMPTAILCAADVYAIAFMYAAQRLGMRVPEDLSLVAIDDTETCECVRPRLTSVRQPLEAMGAAAVEALVRRIREPAAIPVRQVFDVELIQRDSCAPRGASAVRTVEPAIVLGGGVAGGEPEWKHRQ